MSRQPQKPRLNPARLRLVRAGIGTHRLSAGLLAGSPVGMLSTEQLEDVKAFITMEVERMAELDDDAAVTRLNHDIKAIDAERERRWAELVA